MADLSDIIAGPARQNGAVVPSQTLTVSTTAVAFTPFPQPATQYVVFDVYKQAVRVRWDGTAPTAVVGHDLLPSSSFIWTVNMFNAAQFIRDTSATSDATLFASALTTK